MTRVISRWRCPACDTRLTLFVPPHGNPQCAHTGRRALKPVAMVPVSDSDSPDPPEAA